MIKQLDPTLPVETPLGSGWAHFIFEHGDEHHIQWHVAVDEICQFWTFNNPDIRVAYNITMGRPKPTKPYQWGPQWNAIRASLGLPPLPSATLDGTVYCGVCGKAACQFAGHCVNQFTDNCSNARVPGISSTNTTLCYVCGLDYDEPFEQHPKDPHVCPLCIGIKFAKERRMSASSVGNSLNRIYHPS